MAPESNHTSMRSVSRFIGLPVLLTRMIESRMDGADRAANSSLRCCRPRRNLPADYVSYNRIDAARYLHLELCHRSDAYLFLAVIGHPDGQGVPRSGNATGSSLPGFQATCRSACAGALRLPFDGVIELYHTVAQGGGAYEPGVKRVVEYRFICAQQCDRYAPASLCGKLFLLFEHHAMSTSRWRLFS